MRRAILPQKLAFLPSSPILRSKPLGSAVAANRIASRTPAIAAGMMVRLTGAFPLKTPVRSRIPKTTSATR